MINTLKVILGVSLVVFGFSLSCVIHDLNTTPVIQPQGEILATAIIAPDYHGHPGTHVLAKDAEIKTFKVAASGSMLPLMDEYCLVTATATFTQSDIMVGDVVIYDDEIIHRVIDIDLENGAYLVKGDNNALCDGWIGFERIDYIMIGIDYTP